MRKRRYFKPVPVEQETPQYSAIAELPLSVRTINHIEKEAGFVYLYQIIPLTRDQIKEMLPDNGDRIVDELVKALQLADLDIPETWIRNKKRARNKTRPTTDS